MEEETVPAPVQEQAAASETIPEPVAETTPELGFMELLREPESCENHDADATERVLARRRPSAWDF
ncbi:MAG: hypothetical protein NC339_01880 [Muribaculaceae bacterium]|nr:hypothetical protein [Muribaculaceae bacterium]